MPNLLRDEVFRIIREKQGVAQEKIESEFQQIDAFYSGCYDELCLIRSWIINIRPQIDLFKPELKILLQFLENNSNSIINSSVHSSYTEGKLFATMDLIEEFKRIAARPSPKTQRRLVVHLCAKR